MLALLEIAVGLALLLALFWLMDLWADRQRMRDERVTSLTSRLRTRNRRPAAF